MNASSDYNPYVWATIGADDLELFDRLLRDFVPPDGFDAHAHLWRVADLRTPMPPLAAAGPDDVTRAVYDKRLSMWMPDRVPSGGLFFPFPTRDLNVAAANRFLADQMQGDRNSRGLMIVTPADDPAEVERQILHDGFAGFKVYHLFAECTDTFFVSSDKFIPEWAWELAHRHRLVITLHMVLPRALAEPANQSYIREHCERYPQANLILAHAARGFCGRHTVDGIDSIRGLDNVYFDTSAVCEPVAFEAILKAFGSTRLMFGTDFGVSEMRSRCVNLADGFLWLDELQPDFERSRFAKPTVLGIESLLALRQACRNQHLNDGDVERIFCTNARQLLQLASPPDGSVGQAQYARAKHLIPGGTQLLSKRPEMFAPDAWPAYYEQAIGCEVVDTSGRRFVDMSYNGILACILGFADPDVNAAVIRRVQFGSMATQQTHDEVRLAELLIEIHPWADMARFTRTGGEAAAVAVRIARAATGREKVAICGYHGWHDWYLAANLSDDDSLNGHLLPGLQPTGVPDSLRGTTFPFRYNHLEELDAVIAGHGPELAAIVMEPTRHIDPEHDFLGGVRERASRLGAKLIFDEISVGWRLCLGGAHLIFGVQPDMAIFAKTISNGFAMGAVIGNAETMSAAEESFISSAYWTEGIGPAAAVATIEKMRRLNVPAHLAEIGNRLRRGWKNLGEQTSVPVTIGGRPESVLIGFDHADANALMTLFTRRMLDHGFLASAGFNPTLAHQPRHVDRYLEAAQGVLLEIHEAIECGDVMQRIDGKPKHTMFARLTG